VRSLKIIHISDLHIGSKFRAYKPSIISGFSEGAEESMEALANAAGRADATSEANRDSQYCIVSGDLTAFGHQQDFSNALAYIKQSIVIQTKNIGLKYEPNTWVGVYGNHDIWGGRTSLVAWYPAQHKKLIAKQETGWHEPVRRGEFKFGQDFREFIDADCIRIRFYLVDSTLPGWRNVFARGRVSSKALEELQTIVEHDQTEDKKCDEVNYVLRIAVLHHPVSFRWSGAILESMVLENGPKVLEELDNAGFGLVLCGHEHSFAYDGLMNDMYELTAGTALQLLRGGGKNSFAFIELDDPNTMLNREKNTCKLTFRKMVREYGKNSNTNNKFYEDETWTDPIRVVSVR